MPPIDVPTFLTTLYTQIDDWYQQDMAACKPTRPGPAPTVSDSEVLTWAVLREWLGCPSEGAFLATVERHWQAYFPTLSRPVEN